MTALYGPSSSLAALLAKLAGEARQCVEGRREVGFERMATGGFRPVGVVLAVLIGDTEGSMG